MKDYNGRKAVTIYVTDEMLARINDAAQAVGHTRSKYLSNLLEETIPEFAYPDDLKWVGMAERKAKAMELVEAHHKFAADMEASMIDTMAYYF